MNQENIGLIDIGSNTIRLVIFEITEDFNLFELQNIKTPARLFQYLDEEKRMSQKGIDVLIAILKNFRDVADRYEVSKLLPMATAAIRQSKNRDEIVRQVKDGAGIEMQIVPEEKEAFYGSYAVLHTTQYQEGITVDIGGGSTEITLFEDKQLKRSHSFPFGVVTLKQMFFEGKEHNNEKAIKKMTSFIKEQFQTLSWISGRQVPVIAIGGSARSIANVHQRQNNYPLAGVHGYIMDRTDLESTLNIFRSLSIPELQNLDGLSEDRADIIIPANVVFNCLFDEVKASRFVFSNKGLREGIIIEYLNEKSSGAAYTLQNIATQSVYRLGLSYHALNDVADQRGKLASMLYRELAYAGVFEHDNYLERILQYGSYLYYLGQYVEGGASSQHTFYIISNSELDAIPHRERVLIALMASYKSRSLFNQYLKPYASWFNVTFLDKILALGGIIKFAHALNDSHLNVVQDIFLRKQEDGYELMILHKGAVIAEKYRANRQKKNIARLLPGENLTLTFRQLAD